jgi:hypothetical protein
VKEPKRFLQLQTKGNPGFVDGRRLAVKTPKKLAAIVETADGGVPRGPDRPAGRQEKVHN